MALAAEAELVAMFYSAQEAIPLRRLLEKLRHKQCSTPITTDNATAKGLISGATVPRKSKIMDMRFHWLRCCSAQDQIEFRWDKGDTNRADYFSKHHPPIVHRQKRQEYLVNNCCHKKMHTAYKKDRHYLMSSFRQTGRHKLQGCAGNPDVGQPDRTRLAVTQGNISLWRGVWSERWGNVHH